jgi:redox-sensitive bicupin YhaK (pirin superfamily)
VYINSNSTVYWARLENEKSITFKTFGLRLTFIYVKEGSLTVNGTVLGTSDQARLTAEEVVEITATKDAQFILIDLPGSESNY